MVEPFKVEPAHLEVKHQAGAVCTAVHGVEEEEQFKNAIVLPFNEQVS